VRLRVFCGRLRMAGRLVGKAIFFIEGGVVGRISSCDGRTCEL